MYESLLMACEFGDPRHPLYHQCDKCPDTHTAPQPFDWGKFFMYLLTGK